MEYEECVPFVWQSKFRGWLFENKFTAGKTIEINHSNKFEEVKSIKKQLEFAAASKTWILPQNRSIGDRFLENVRNHTFQSNFKFRIFRSIEN